jgi:hypothetical protein
LIEIHDMRTIAALFCSLMSIALLAAGDAPAPAAPAASAAPAQPVLKITPGKIIIPTDAGMQRIWGELVSMDLATRSGTFRKDGTDQIRRFTVMPYAELLHHATLGDLQDFRIGERAIFRLHQDEKGEWVALTYIQDEMNMMNNHKEYFYVVSIDQAKGRFSCTWANADQSFIRQKDVLIETDHDTRYWKGASAATFADIAVGAKLRTKTHGIGAGNTRMCWEIFLDDESLIAFQTAQKAVHERRMAEEGLPGYVDAAPAASAAPAAAPAAPLVPDRLVQFTLFPEGRGSFALLKVGGSVRVAPAGPDRKPTMPGLPATITAVSGAEVTVSLPASAAAAFLPTGVARLWPGRN